MNKKLFVGFVPLLAIVAFALTPAAAQALEPHWKKNNVELPKGAAPTTVASKTAIMTFSWGGKERFACKGTDEEQLWNPLVGAGEDEITALVFHKCKYNKKYYKVCPLPPTTLVVEAVLPWKSLLVVAGPLIRDEITGVKLAIGCIGGPSIGEIAGTISPEVGNEFLEFTGAPSTLEYNIGGPAVTVEKKDKLPTITAE
jgi:hypothetical protein